MLLVVWLVAACNPLDDYSVIATRQGSALPSEAASPELAAIDSLMWQRPDSALSVLIDFMAYCTIPNYPLRAGQTDFTLAVEEIETTAFATVHPNPTNGLFTITGKNMKTVEVLNTLGQLVATASGKGETMQIDIANLPAGVYFVRVTDEEGRKCVRKVVKE